MMTAATVWPAHVTAASTARAIGTCLLLAATQSVFSQGDTIDHHIPFVADAPRIDGVIGESEWSGAELVRLTNETHPSQNIPALVDTEVMIMEDGANFYVAFIAHDPEPKEIRAYYRDRDQSWNDDFVGVVIDTFNDERRAFEFFANPFGAQMDMIMDDVNGNEDSSWNAIWDTAGKLNDEGFVVEMRIPLNQLRFSEGLDRQTWGIDLLRFYPRDKRHRLSNNTSDYSISCYLCQLKKAQGFANLKQHINLQIVPTVTASYSATRPPTAGSGGWDQSFNPEPGFDIRWGINQDFYLNATYNPDFSQVEADAAQLDINNTFSLFFPERREFFLEGADYFASQANIVHTRNIAAPDYGLKVTGKRNANTYGLFFANDDRTSFVIPGSQGSRIATLDDEQSRNLVLRYRRDIGTNINLGILGTDRRADDYENTVAAIDGSIRIGDSDRIRAQLMRSRSEYPDAIQTGYGQADKIQDNAYLLSYRHDDSRWDWNVDYTEYGDDFRADMGFINRVDYRSINIETGRSWRHGPERKISRLRIGVGGNKIWDEGGDNLEQQVQFRINGEGPLQSFMNLGFGFRERFYNRRYFDEHFAFFYGQTRPFSGGFFSLQINGGNGIDFANTRPGRTFTISPEVGLQIGKHLQLGLKHNYQQLNVDGGNLYRTNLSDFRLTYQFNVRSFVRTVIQYSDTQRDPGLYLFPIDRRSKSLTTQLLYSYKLNAQTRFFVGYSNTGLDNDRLDQIRLTNHTVFTKFSYAWQL